MEDSNFNSYSIENNENKKDKIKKWLFPIIIICSFIAVFFITLFIVYKVKYAFNIDKKDFELSDSSNIIFYDKNKYMLSYEIMSNNIVMLGEYNMLIDSDIPGDITQKYENYTSLFNEEKYRTGYLELNNKELYINGEKEETGDINTDYILMLYYDDGKMEFKGYNVNTGIKIKFEEQKGKYDEIYNQNSKYLTSEN